MDTLVLTINDQINNPLINVSLVNPWHLIKHFQSKFIRYPTWYILRLINITISLKYYTRDKLLNITPVLQTCHQLLVNNMPIFREQLISRVYKFYVFTMFQLGRNYWSQVVAAAKPPSQTITVNLMAMQSGRTNNYEPFFIFILSPYVIRPINVHDCNRLGRYMESSRLYGCQYIKWSWIKPCGKVLGGNKLARNFGSMKMQHPDAFTPKMYTDKFGSRFDSIFGSSAPLVSLLPSAKE